MYFQFQTRPEPKNRNSYIFRMLYVRYVRPWIFWLKFYVGVRDDILNAHISSEGQT